MSFQITLKWVNFWFILIFWGIINSPVTFAQNRTSRVKVTFVANEGFLIKSLNHNILIDALFTNGYKTFATPSQGVIQQIMNRQTPFDSVDLCFFTHYHKDHLDTKLVSEYLKDNPSVKLVTTRPSLVFIDGDQFGFVKLKNQFCEITPAVNQSVFQVIQDIPVTALGFKHLSYFQNGIDLEEYMFNTGFFIKLDGIKILHTGDADIENLKDFYNNNKTWNDSADIAFIYYKMLNNGKSDLDYLVNTLHPKFLVLMHVPPLNYPEWSDKVNQLKTYFPNIILFKNCMETFDFSLDMKN